MLFPKFTSGGSALADIQSQYIKSTLSLDMHQIDARDTATAILCAGGLSNEGIASWFKGLNSFLDDQIPESLLYTDPDWVIDAVYDTAAEMHPRPR